MKPFLVLLVLASQGLIAETLPFDRKGSLVVLNEVYLSRQGPFRMMLDTGAESSVMRTAVARRLGIRPAYAVEQVTAAGVRRTPATVLDEVKSGSVLENSVEFLIADGFPAGVDGVLGQSWLGTHDYLIDYRHRRLVLDEDPPDGGIRLGLRPVENRPAVQAAVDGHTTELVLDSGANMLVLFGFRAPASALMFTSNGSVLAGVGPAEVSFGGERARVMNAARVDGTKGGGLLPLAEFGSVYVSNRSGYVILVR